MNTSRILFHNIKWFLRQEDCNSLNETWEEQITNFIINGNLQGEFAIETDNQIDDSLIWKIDFEK